MQVGMLWFDSEPESSFDERLSRAVDYYLGKYGARPDICYVHGGEQEDESVERVDEVEVHTSSLVLPEHFWLGVKSKALDGVP